METLFLLLIFVLTTIPPSRQSRATSLYTREAMTTIILALQTPICTPKVKQARQKQENKAFAELVIISINPSFRKLFFTAPYLI